MMDWLLAGKPPKGVNKPQAQETARNPALLQVAGILSSDYNAQRLPGAKFFKPLGTLLAHIAAGMQYQAVNKHDLQRGLPNKGWNDGPAAGAPKPAAAGPTPPLPAGKAGKAAKAAAAKAAAAANKTMQQNAPASRSNSQLAGANRSRSSTPGGPVPSDGPASTPTAAKSSSFKHPMALRQQQRQQEALLAAAGAAGLPGQPGAQNPGVGLGQLGKGLAPTAGRTGPMSQPGSASRSILTAANMGGPAAMQAGLMQQQQFAGAAAAVAAQQAGPGKLAQALAGQQAQFLTPQQQMQAASMAFLQAQPGASQAVWLKQQQMAGAGMPVVVPAGQTLMGYPGLAGYPMGQPGAPQQADGGLPRSSSTGSSAQQQGQQQPAPPSASGAQQQLVQSADGQGWQLQEQAAAGKARPPAFAMGQPGIAPGQPGVPPSPQLVQAAALLFLQDHHQQQQQQPSKPDGPQTSWWVQRMESAFSGPFTGLQMYQAYLQPAGPLRLTESTPIAVAAAGPAAGNRDVPPARAFAPISCLLEAAAHGFVPAPWPTGAAAGGRDGGPSTLLVQQLATGATVPLQSVLSQAGLLALQQQQQQQQQQGNAGGEQPCGKGPGSEAGQQGSQQQQMLAASKQWQQQQQQQQHPQLMPGGWPGAAGGFIQLPNGQLVPAAGLVSVQGGGLAMLQPNLASAAPQPANVDPLAVANALFTAGGQPNTIVWYIRTDAAAGSDGQQASSIQGPFDPQVGATQPLD
jgi:hypothetical protein